MFSPVPLAAHPGYIAGRRYPLTPAPMATLTPGAVDVIYLFPSMLAARLPFTAMALMVMTGGAGSAAKVGVWANSPVSMRPLGAPLFVDNTGVATTTSTANAAFATGSGVLGAGVPYWVGVKFTGTLPSIKAVSGDSAQYHAWLAGIASASLGSATGLSFADAYANAMPTFAEGASFTVSAVNMPVVWAVT